MTRFLIASLVGLLLVGSVQAAPLKPGDLPADAKWVMHLDGEAARQTKIAEQFKERRLDEPRIREGLAWVEARYGIDLRKDVKSVTAYGSNYDPHTGIVILRSDYDRDKVKQVMQAEEGHERQSHRDHEVHTWMADKERRVAAVFYDETTVVIGANVEKVKAALDVLDGEKDPMSKDAALIADIPDDAVFYGAGVELRGLEGREGFLILQQAEKLTVAVGGKEGKTYLDAKFVGKTEDVAEQVKNVVDGVRNLLALQAQDVSEEAHELARALKVEREDRTLKIQWRADADQVVKVARQLEERGAIRR